MDVAEESSVDAMVDAVVERWGRVDVLINNASIFATLKKEPFDEIPLAEWERVLRVNVTGTFLCTRAVAPTCARPASAASSTCPPTR